MGVTAQQPVKVSMQSQRAGDTAKHNDRTMYKRGYFNDLAPNDGIPNFHWTKEKFGVDSDQMEHDVYESLYLDTIRQRNETYAANYQWAKVYDLEDEDERKKAVDDFRWKHPPRETIFQVGSMDNPIDRELARKILIEQGEKMVAQQNENFMVLSYDVHMDEGSPHMHARFLMLDADGMPNTEGALKEMGVEPPTPYDEWAREENARRQARADADPGYVYRPATAKTTARNNRLVTFTREMREEFEEAVMGKGIAIDTTRTRKKHLTQAQERTRRAVEDAEKKQRAELAKEQTQLARLNEAAANARKTRDTKIKARTEELKRKLADGDKELKARLQYNNLKARNDSLLEGLKSRDENELGTFYDKEGEEINEEWFTKAHADVEAASFRESKKQRVRNALDALERAINEPQTELINVSTLEQLQRNYDAAQRPREEAEQLAAQRQAGQTTQAQNGTDNDKQIGE